MADGRQATIEVGNMKSKLFLIFNLLFVFTWISCTPTPENVSTVTLSGNNCIDTKENFAIPISSSSENILPDDAVAPLSPWELVITISGQSKIDFARTKNESIELWIRNSVKPEPFIEEGRLISYTELEERLLIYHTENNTIKEISTAFDDVPPPTGVFQSGLVPSGIYLGDSGKIWNLTRDLEYKEIEIGVYDEDAKKFRPLTFSNNVPRGTIVFDKQREVFWAFDLYEEPSMIYSIDLISLEIKKHISFPPGFIGSKDEVAISSQGDIFFTTVNGNQRWDQSSYDVFKFNPSKNAIESIRNEHPQSLRYRIYFEPFGGVFIDQSENLWIGTQALVTPAGEWHKILHAPIILTRGLIYDRGDPIIVMESSDTRLWIEFPNGMMWLDTQKDEWCWFTTYRNNIREDVDGNLWMIAGEGLYKLPAKSTEKSKWWVVLATLLVTTSVGIIMWSPWKQRKL